MSRLNTPTNGPASIQLVSPAVKYRESFMRGLREFQTEGLAWWSGGDMDIAEHDFSAFVAKKLSEAGPETNPPKTHLWAISEGQFVGRIAIFHTLTEALRISGGHIGYDTVPSFRGQGIAKEMLRQALPVARELGLTEVLITCDDTNVPSIRVIEKNGGVLQEKKTLPSSGAVKRYYWIQL